MASLRSTTTNTANAFVFVPSDDNTKAPTPTETRTFTATLDEVAIERVVAVCPNCDAEVPGDSCTACDTEVRDSSEGMTFKGHAAIFDRLSEDLGGFRERINRGAFRKVLATEPDVRFLVNHDPSKVLARTKAGTMKLREDAKGLLVEADIAPTSYGRDLGILVKRGDISQMSFGFTIADGGDSWDETRSPATRTIHELGNLLDVSAVTFPAYAQTDASIRSICGVTIFGDDEELLIDDLRNLAWSIHKGDKQASVEERALIDTLLHKTPYVTPWDAERVVRAMAQEPELQAVIPRAEETVEVTESSSGKRQSLCSYEHRLRVIELN